MGTQAEIAETKVRELVAAYQQFCVFFPLGLSSNSWGDFLQPSGQTLAIVNGDIFLSACQELRMILMKSLKRPPRVMMKCCYTMQLCWNGPWISQGREVATSFCLWFPSQNWHWSGELPSASLFPLTYQMAYLPSAESFFSLTTTHSTDKTHFQARGIIHHRFFFSGTTYEAQPQGWLVLSSLQSLAAQGDSGLD